MGLTATMQVAFFCLAAVSGVDENGETAADCVTRGMEQFRETKIAASIRSFDQAVEIDPRSDPYLWQRGISYYYVGEFAKGRKQFESHRAVNPNDVENAAWHFICVARTEGVDAARKAIIKIDTARDTRIPMAEVYALYAGRGTAASVLQAAEKADTERARMYAHLYLGLFYEVAGDKDKAREHMHKSAAAKLQGQFMHDVAKVHLLQRKW